MRRVSADLGDICRGAREDVAIAHPDCRFELELSGDLRGQFDAGRLQQLLLNLLNNAVQYRGPGEPVTLIAEGTRDGTLIKVHNTGPVIPPSALGAIFDPLVQLAVAPDAQGRPSTSMGLGLFIARDIASAHGGSIKAHSSAEEGTVFQVTLPRS